MTFVSTSGALRDRDWMRFDQTAPSSLDELQRLDCKLRDGQAGSEPDLPAELNLNSPQREGRRPLELGPRLTRRPRSVPTSEPSRASGAIRLAEAAANPIHGSLPVFLAVLADSGRNQ